MIEALAWALLAYQGVALVWDLLEPDALKIKVNSPFRGVVAVAALIAQLVMLLAIVGASTVAVAAVFVVFLVAVILSIAAGQVS